MGRLENLPYYRFNRTGFQRLLAEALFLGVFRLFINE